ASRRAPRWAPSAGPAGPARRGWWAAGPVRTGEREGNPAAHGGPAAGEAEPRQTRPPAGPANRGPLLNTTERPAHSGRGPFIFLECQGSVQPFGRKTGAHVVLPARNMRRATAAVRAFRLRGADVVVCDLFMPRTDGLEAVRALRREFPGVKVLAISGG